MSSQRSNSGFTLLELSMVLVIISLLAGAIFVGESLIKSAAINGTISQYEQIKSAVSEFHDKYQALPGDLTAAQATQYNFAPTTRIDSQANTDPSANPGTMLIHGDGFYYDSAPSSFVNIGLNSYGSLSYMIAGSTVTSEALLFWQDLASAHIFGGFSSVTSDTGASTYSAGTGYTTPVSTFLLTSKIGPNIFWGITSFWQKNYLTLNGITALNGYTPAISSGLTPLEAFNIDTKLDDGLPYSGKVLASKGNYAMNENYTLLVEPVGGEPTNCTVTTGNVSNGNSYSVDTYPNIVNCNLAIEAGF